MTSLWWFVIRRLVLGLRQLCKKASRTQNLNPIFKTEGDENQALADEVSICLWCFSFFRGQARSLRIQERSIKYKETKNNPLDMIVWEASAKVVFNNAEEANGNDPIEEKLEAIPRIYYGNLLNYWKWFVWYSLNQQIYLSLVNSFWAPNFTCFKQKIWNFVWINLCVMVEELVPGKFF